MLREVAASRLVRPMMDPATPLRSAQDDNGGSIQGVDYREYWQTAPPTHNMTVAIRQKIPLPVILREVKRSRKIHHWVDLDGCDFAQHDSDECTLMEPSLRIAAPVGGDPHTAGPTLLHQC